MSFLGILMTSAGLFSEYLLGQDESKLLEGKRGESTNEGES